MARKKTLSEKDKEIIKKDFLSHHNNTYPEVAKRTGYPKQAVQHFLHKLKF